MLRSYFVGHAVASLYLCLYVLMCPVLSSRSDEGLELCFNPNSTTQMLCSGRGECVMGVCDCYARRAHSNQKYSGKYCQCDDYSCLFSNNMLCGGPSRGRCNCGVCMCEEGYTSDACDCPISQETCLSSNGQLCNGVGVCECGVCSCNPDSSYKGPTCEECPTCPGKCAENKACVECVAFATGPYTKEECEALCGHVRVYQVIDEDRVKTDENVNLCQFLDEDDCRFLFTYEYVENNKVLVKVQATKVCPEIYHGGNVDDGPGGGATQPMSSFFLVVLIANVGAILLRQNN